MALRTDLAFLHNYYALNLFISFLVTSSISVVSKPLYDYKLFYSSSSFISSSKLLFILSGLTLFPLRKGVNLLTTSMNVVFPLRDNDLLSVF